MAKPYSSCVSGGPSSLPLQTRNEVLERAVEKMVWLGARAGIDADQMIEMLDSGMTAEELLQYVLSLTP